MSGGSSRIEAAARALFEHEYQRVEWSWEQEGKSPELRDYWLDAAKAALWAADSTDPRTRALQEIRHSLSNVNVGVYRAVHNALKITDAALRAVGGDTE